MTEYGDLQFNDHDIDELREVDTLYLGDISRFKKNDDLRHLNSQSPIAGIPQPSPFIDRPPQRRPRHPVQATGPSNTGTRLCRITAVVGFVACTLFLFAIIASTTIDNFRHHDHNDGRGVHNTGGPIAMVNQGITAVALAGDSPLNMEFTTTTVIQNFVAYDISTNFPQLDFDSLSNYRICCWTSDSKFICGSGYTFSNGLALDGYLAKEEVDKISLYLNVNSLALAESRCELTLWTKPA